MIFYNLLCEQPPQHTKVLRLARDATYRIGVEIACIWQPDPKNVDFSGVPSNSNTRRYEKAWLNRDKKKIDRRMHIGKESFLYSY
ncbi:MAG: hypothetical protein ACRD5E_08400 [Nitrososphaeraceae archaeon]